MGNREDCPYGNAGFRRINPSDRSVISPLAVLLAFILFRLFDILKPGPVDWAQRLPGGWGIMSDDVLAGVFANLSLRLVMIALPMLPFGVTL